MNYISTEWAVLSVPERHGWGKAAHGSRPPCRAVRVGTCSASPFSGSELDVRSSDKWQQLVIGMRSRGAGEAIPFRSRASRRRRRGARGGAQPPPHRTALHHPRSTRRIKQQQLVPGQTPISSSNRKNHTSLRSVRCSVRSVPQLDFHDVSCVARIESSNLQPRAAAAAEQRSQQLSCNGFCPWILGGVGDNWPPPYFLTLDHHLSLTGVQYLDKQNSIHFFN
jgi:hypothetical protein